MIYSNKKIIEVKEFDIISKDTFSEKQCKENDFDKFYSFIKEFNTSTKYESSNFFKLGHATSYGDIIRVQNYVGLIQLKNGDKIQILPKIDSCENDEELKKVFNNMIKCLRGTNAKAINQASLNIKRMNIFEIFINMYIQSVVELFKKGIKSSYESHEENLNIIKGKIKFKENALLNHSHKEMNYVQYDDFSANCPENRIIKSTLKKLYCFSEDNRNRINIKNLLQQLDNIEESFNYSSDFDKIVISRNMKSYETIINWSKVFLLGKSFSTFNGHYVSKSLLFPMEKVFEDYVSYHVKRVFNDEGYKVKTQVRTKYLFDIPKRFNLKPDIYITSNKNNSIILDTKWKLLDKTKFNYGISQSDMYQMYAYCKKYNTEHAYLLYPVSKSFIRDDSRYVFTTKDNVNVHIFFIDLVNINNSIKNLKKDIIENGN